MIVAVGIDVVLVERFARALARTPLLAERLFTEAELNTPSGNPRSPESLAARFAAKEATIKVLRPNHWLDWRSIEVIRKPPGFTELLLSGEAAELAEAAGLDDFAVSLSHEGHYATAVVVACARKP